MLILVGVTVTVALNGGLFSTAKGASKATNAERDREQTLASGQVEIDGKKYASYEDYLNNNPILPYKKSIEGLAEGVQLIPINQLTGDLKTAAQEEKINAVLEEEITTADGTTKLTAVVPTGYEVSTEDGEDSISGGLVITDGTNEFVWIPVTSDFSNSYNYSSEYSEPIELSRTHSTTGYAYDTQEELNYYYGQKEDGTNYYNFDTNFNYSSHYEEMLQSVNKYDGFYIGRYETTIDENGNIGSKENTTVLSANQILREGTNTTSNEAYYYRWWGLYDSQRNSNVAGNGNYVQANMVWGQQWDAMLTFIGEEQASSKITGSQSGVLKSGEATYDNNLKDKMNNICDLRRNVYEWTAEAYSDIYRVYRGGVYHYNISASQRNYMEYPFFASPEGSFDGTYGSRLTLYIK